MNLFNRANHFRMINEFDKAIGAYEKILDADDSNAEAHWGIVLSRYGIEYVEDPISHAEVFNWDSLYVLSLEEFFGIVSTSV